MIVHRATGQTAGHRFGPYQIETILTPDEERAGTAYRVRIEPHQRTAVSYHKIAEENYFVIAGRGVAILDGREQPMQAGDFLRLPPGCTHGFVTGDEPRAELERASVRISCWSALELLD
ncbi:MAG: cupin domain-containing protein [Nitrospirae bacterium]|nr:cupin domain-containing protein [Nitrospirota bacterium]